jgi:hypothetical protein
MMIRGMNEELRNQAGGNTEAMRTPQCGASTTRVPGDIPPTYLVTTNQKYYYGDTTDRHEYSMRAAVDSLKQIDFPHRQT